MGTVPQSNGAGQRWGKQYSNSKQIEMYLFILNPSPLPSGRTRLLHTGGR